MVDLRRAPRSALRRAPSSDRGEYSEYYGYCELFSTDWWLISLALAMMIFVLLVGSPAIVVFIACVTAIAWRSPGLALRSLAHFSPILIAALFVIASTAWSDAPDVTLKQSLEVFLTIACSIILARRISGADLGSALLLPSFVLCLSCLAIQPSALHGVPLQGFIGSKNQFAFLAQVLLLSGVAVLMDGRFPPGFRLLALVGVALGVLDVVLARSAGAWITSVLFVITFIAFRASERLSLGSRVGVGAAAIGVLLPCIVAYKSVFAAVQDFQVKVLHKDMTLTGRTGLWTFSKSLIAERPVFGHGFAAFWRQGNLDAEGLWRQLGIASRTGINFHNQFIDITVDFGYVGLGLFIVCLTWIAVICLWRSISRPSISGAFLAAILVALYSRLPVESVLLGAWNIFTLLWVAVAVQSLAPTFNPERSKARGTQVGRARGAAWRGRAAPHPGPAQ